MDISNILSLFCGVALFLFGMSLMGDGLKKVAGNRLELLLYKLTNTTWKGILLGTGVTAVIQSSSATSIMVVGFVNSGMMHFRQAIGIILGAILGTSITGWIIALSELSGGNGWVSLLSTSTLTGIMAVIGIFLHMCKGESKMNVGGILLGFAVLMVGMNMMSESVSPLQEYEQFISLLTAFSNPLLGTLAGVVFASILQSSSAAVGIVQALTATGAINFNTAFPLIMGIAIGAAVPILLSALGASVDGKRTAFVYLLASIVGVIVCGGGLYALNAIFSFDFMEDKMTAISVARINTVFRFINVIILCPFIGILETVTCRLISEKEKTAPIEKHEIVPLEDRFLPYPALAISQCRKAIRAMARATDKSVEIALALLEHYSEEQFKRVRELENITDKYEDSIGTYLLKITRHELSKEENSSVSKYLHTLPDFERITDHALEVAYVARAIHQQNVIYSPEAQRELSIVKSALSENVRITVAVFEQSDLQLAKRVEPLSDVIDELCDELKAHHIDRLQTGVCTMEQGLSFNDILMSFRQISNHCAKIVRAVLELKTDAFNTHAYHHAERAEGADEQIFTEYKNKYAVYQGSEISF